MAVYHLNYGYGSAQNESAERSQNMAYQAALAQAQAVRGTMRPINPDPDEGTRSHGDAIEMIYDECEGVWVEQRKLT